MKKKFDTFLMGSHSRLGIDSNVMKISRCLPALQMIMQYVVPDQDRNKKRQLEDLEKQLDILFPMIDIGNKYAIPAFLNPASILSLDAPHSSSHGSVEEAYCAVADGHCASKFAISDLTERYAKIYGPTASKEYRNPEVFKAELSPHSYMNF